MGIYLDPRDTLYPDKIRKHTSLSSTCYKKILFLPPGFPKETFSLSSYLTSFDSFFSHSAPGEVEGWFLLLNLGRIYIRMMVLHKKEKQENGLESTV